jgi:hypothetical protein
MHSRESVWRWSIWCSRATSALHSSRHSGNDHSDLARVDFRDLMREFKLPVPDSYVRYGDWWLPEPNERACAPTALSRTGFSRNSASHGDSVRW